MDANSSKNQQSNKASYRKKFWESLYSRLAVLILTWSVGLASGVVVLGIKAVGIDRLGRTPNTANITGCWSYKGPTYSGELYLVDNGDREIIGSYVLDRGNARSVAQGLISGIRDGGKGTVDFDMAPGFHSDTKLNIKGTLHQEWEAMEILVQSAQEIDMTDADVKAEDLIQKPTIVASRSLRQQPCRFQERAGF